MRWKGGRVAKQKAGEGKCPACDSRVVWRLADSGSLSCFCQDCDFQGYAKEGTEAKRLILAGIGATASAPAVKQEAKPAPVSKPETEVKPASKGAFGVFGL